MLYIKFVGKITREMMKVKTFKSFLNSSEKKLIFKILFIFIIISRFPSLELLKSYDSTVLIKISGNGEKLVFFDELATRPYKVYIDNVEKSGINYKYNLNENNVVKLVWNRPITNCKRMFKNCDSIVEIKFVNFDTSQSINMASMFFNCKSLKTLDLSSFNTLKVTKFSDMFKYCYALVSVDVSNFDVRNAVNMGNMFGYCHSLISVDLSSFNTINAQYIDNMFRDCKSIKSVIFPNLDTSNAINKGDMFLNCNNLKYIDFKNYKTNNILNDGFFKGTPTDLIITIEKKELIRITDKNKCIISISLNNINEFTKKINTEDDSCTEDCKLTNYHYEYNNKCYEECSIGTYNDNFKCKDCHENCKECDGPYTPENNNCITCISDEKFLNYGNCISNCPRDYYINRTNNQNTCKCELEQCLTCSIESINLNLCTSCDNDYYPIYDDLNKFNPYLNCSKSPEGYFLYTENGNSVYKSCYISCKSCNIEGNENEHNCVECKNNYYFETHLNNFKNCFSICLYYYYFDEIKNITFCTTDFQCPLYYDKLIEEKRQCVFNCNISENYKYEFQKKCYMQCPENSTERIDLLELRLYDINAKYFCKPICIEEYPFEITYLQECVKKCDVQGIINESCIINYRKNENINIFDIFLKTIEDDFISGNFDSSEIEKGFDEIIEYNQIKVALSTTINQKNNGNMTTIDLKECEIILKDVYNISYNETLFIKKIEVMQEEMMIPKIEFEVYYKLNRTNLIKLNLSYCTNSKIDIFIPIKLEGNLDIFNSSSGYYNDLCYTATSDYGTDIILKDRRNEFIENNKAVCQENCVFSEYDNIFQKVKCTCDVPKSSDKFENIKIDKSKLLNNFIDIKNIANINFLLCYKVLFTKKGIINNYGSYSIIFIIIIHFIIIIIFYFKKLLNEINDRIKEISFGVKYIKLHKEQILENKRKIKKRKRKNKKIKNTIKEKINYKKVKNINNILQINFDKIQMKIVKNHYHYKSSKNCQKIKAILDIIKILTKQKILIKMLKKY